MRGRSGRISLSEREQRDVAELAPPGRTEIAIEPGEVVDVHNAGYGEAPPGRSGFDLLQMRDVRFRGNRAESLRERSAPELAAGLHVGARASPEARRLERNVDELHRQVGRRC